MEWQWIIKNYTIFVIEVVETKWEGHLSAIYKADSRWKETGK